MRNAPKIGPRMVHIAMAFAIAMGCSPPTPPDASCNDPVIIEGDTGTWTGTVAPTPSITFMCGFNAAPRPAYAFAWKPFSSGVAVISVHGTQGEDLMLEVQDLTCEHTIACNDNYMGVNSQVTMNVQAGTLYTLLVGTFADLPQAIDFGMNIQVTAGAVYDAGPSDADAADAAEAGEPGELGNLGDAGTPWWNRTDASDVLDATVQDAEVGTADVAPTTQCAGSPSFSCPTSLTCSNGAGNAVKIPLVCGVSQGGVTNVCAFDDTADGGEVDGGAGANTNCLGAQMTCYGPDSSVWQCPTRWVTLDGMGNVTHVPNCCLWITTSAVPHGDCGVTSASDASICQTPVPGMSPEN